jgi:hypothetical protein
MPESLDMIVNRIAVQFSKLLRGSHSISKFLLLVVASLFILTACGGGGSGNEPQSNELIWDESNWNESDWG